MSRIALVAALCVLAALPAAATTYTVNDHGDASDATPGNDVCATAGAVCTLRAAIQEADAHPGTDTIRFSVTGTIAPASDLPAITSPVDLHGEGKVVLQGLNFIYALEVGPGGDGSVIRGLQIHGFRIGINVHNVNDVVIGGTTPGDGNVLSGNVEAGLYGYLVGPLEVYGNTIGLNAARTAASANGMGIDLWFSLGPVIIGSAGAGMNVISGNQADGIRWIQPPIPAKTPDRRLTLAPLTYLGMSVIGNRIGTDGTGMTAIGNGMDGISWDSYFDDGPGIFEDNLISGNGQDGIDLSGGGPRTLHRNIIGRNATNTAPLPNGGPGVYADVATGSIIVGSPVLGGNVIASNGGAGVQVNSGPAAPATIIANSIFDNGGLGIDLLGTGFGVTPNDPLDADTGPSGLQNFPVIASVIAAATTNVQGTLDSKPSTSYALHFYASDVPDPSHYGEGQTYLGTTNVTTDGAGHASFAWTGPPVAPARYLTATATSSEGTSEFSLAAVVQPATVGAVPAASTWALLLLFAALGAIAVVRMR